MVGSRKRGEAMRCGAVISGWCWVRGRSEKKGGGGMNYGNVGSAKEQKRGENELNKWGSTDDLQLKIALPWTGQDSQPWTMGAVVTFVRHGMSLTRVGGP